MLQEWGAAPDREPRHDCRLDLAHLQYHHPSGERGSFRCNLWNCLCCGHRMKMNLLEGIDALLERRPDMSRLLTLTTDPARHASRDQAHRAIGGAWNALKTALRDAHGDFSHVWVREDTEDGWPHLHVLVSRFLPQRHVARLWEQTGHGRVVDIRQVNARKAGHYLAKYLAKDAMAHLPAGVHRYGSSADVDLEVRGAGGGAPGWQLVAWDPIIGDGGGWRGAVRGDFVADSDRPPPIPLE